MAGKRWNENYAQKQSEWNSAGAIIESSIRWQFAVSNLFLMVEREPERVGELYSSIKMLYSNFMPLTIQSVREEFEKEFAEVGVEVNKKMRLFGSNMQAGRRYQNKLPLKLKKRLEDLFFKVLYLRQIIGAGLPARNTPNELDGLRGMLRGKPKP